MVSNTAGAENAAGQPRAKKASRVWWVVHQWVGLKLSIFMSFILLTGTLATLGHEIDWLLAPGARVNPATVEGPLNWAGMAEAAAADVPEGRIQLLFAPLDPWWASGAYVVDGEGRRRIVLMHPTTAEVRDNRSVVTAQMILRRMHRHLFIVPTQIGVVIVSALSILLAISLVTSFVVYKKWWRGFFKPLRGRDARTWMGDFHRLAGLWTLWFTALMVLTGVWYLVESLGGHAPAMESAEVAPIEAPAPEVAARLAESLAAVREASPDLRLRLIRFPSEDSGAFVFQGQDDAVLVRPRANTVWTEAATGEVKLVTDGVDLSLHQRISEMADPLHFGTFGGIWTKLIWFLFGALMTGLSISGAAIYALRIMKSRREAPRFGSAAALSLQGMGLWKWLETALLAACAVFFVITLFAAL